jgi:transcriptional regulator with XRE-family HTH domain
MWGPGAPRRRVEAPGFARRFGTNLGIHRTAAGISQEDLGDLGAIHRTAVGQLERGERIPRADTLLKLACALGVDTDALLAGIVWKPPQIGRGSFGVEEVDREDGRGNE